MPKKINKKETVKKSPKALTKKIEKKTEKKVNKTPSRIIGVKDFYASEGDVFHLVTSKITEFAELFSFNEVRTPVLESYDLYKKSTRRNNEKDFYFVDGEKGEKVVLRPEMTQGVIRSYLENLNPELPVTTSRLFSLGPVFRREKPQGGHYREFFQANFEIIGDKKPITEAVLIAVVVSFFKELNIKVQIQVNSLGDKDCRHDYCAKLNNFFKDKLKKSKLCNNCKNNLGKDEIGRAHV